MGCGAGKGAGGGKYSAEDSAKLEFLLEVETFQSLPEEDHPGLAKAAENVTFKGGDAIMKQGDKGTEMYVIKKGKCKIIVDGKEVAQLGEKDYVGEASLLKGQPRNATVEAVDNMEVLKISRANFEKMGLNEKLVFKKKVAVGGGDSDVTSKPPCKKSGGDTELIVQALKNNTNMQSMFTLDDNKCNELANLMWKEDFAAGTKIVEEGNLDADYFYILQKGTCKIKQTKKGKVKEIGEIAGGGSFGELALMYRVARAATIEASEACTTFVIDRKQFRAVLTNASAGQVKRWKGHLDNLDIMEPLKDDEKTELAQAMSENVFEQGEEIFKQGQKGKLFRVATRSSGT